LLINKWPCKWTEALSIPVIKKKVWRVIDLINWADQYFLLKGIDNPRQEIEWMLTDILDCNRFDLYLRFEEPFTSDQLELLHQWVKRRVKKEPLQYITGHCEFYGRTFIVNKDVFIPRPETERMVDVAISMLEDTNRPTILDMGTGSGCIAISLAKEIPGSKITAIDISTVALEVAKINADIHHAAVHFEEMDFLMNPYNKKLDMITLNNLKFTKPDIKRFPSLKILKMITKKITLFETVLVSANDQLVDLFLEGKINFLDITIFLKKILRMKIFLKYKKRSPKNYNELINLSNYVRLKTRTLCI